MKASVLFCVLAAVATAAPAVKPRDDAFVLHGGLVIRDGLLDGVGGLVSGLLEQVHDTVLPLLAGEDDSVVHKVIDTVDGILGGLHAPVDLTDLTASLESALDSILADKGLVGQVVSAVKGLLDGVPLAPRALPAPVDIPSLNLPGIPVLGGLLGEVVSLLNGILTSLGFGGILPHDDVDKLTDAVKDLRKHVAYGNQPALQQALAPVLSTISQLTQSVPLTDKDMGSSLQGLNYEAGRLAALVGGGAAAPRPANGSVVARTVPGIEAKLLDIDITDLLGLGGAVGGLVDLVESLLSGLGLGKTIVPSDLSAVTAKVQEVTTAAAQNKEPISDDALKSALAPLLQALDQLLSIAPDASPELKEAQKSVATQVGPMLTSIGRTNPAAIKGLDGLLGEDGLLGGLIHTVVSLLDSLLSLDLLD